MRWEAAPGTRLVLPKPYSPADLDSLNILAHTLCRWHWTWEFVETWYVLSPFLNTRGKVQLLTRPAIRLSCFCFPVSAFTDSSNLHMFQLLRAYRS
jgi:hypothetical protein